MTSADHRKKPRKGQIIVVGALRTSFQVAGRANELTT
jgi:hypothetical protein